MAGLNALVDKIRTAHPGDYDDMDDATLTKKVLAKYPQYSDLAAPSPAASAAQPAQPEFMNPLPTEKIPVVGAMAQPFGELGANLAYDPAFRKETGEYGALAAGATMGAAATPGAVSAIKAMAVAHPYAAKLISRALEGSAATAGGAATYKWIKSLLPD
jgi:hypothetical protein